MLPYSKNLKEPARTLRKEMTDAELKLWSFLRAKQILGIQFYRQKPIGPYIVDFYAPAAMLVIEADGSQHDEPEHVATDQIRDAFLAEQGLLVLRFDNGSILKQTDAVQERFTRFAGKGLKSPLTPLCQRGGRQKRHNGKVLQQDYITEGILSEKWYDDALYVAIATVTEYDESIIGPEDGGNDDCRGRGKGGAD